MREEITLSEHGWRIAGVKCDACGGSPCGAWTEYVCQCGKLKIDYVHFMILKELREISRRVEKMEQEVEKENP